MLFSGGGDDGVQYHITEILTDSGSSPRLAVLSTELAWRRPVPRPLTPASTLVARAARAAYHVDTRVRQSVLLWCAVLAIHCQYGCQAEVISFGGGHALHGAAWSRLKVVLGNGKQLEPPREKKSSSLTLAGRTGAVARTCIHFTWGTWAIPASHLSLSLDSS